MIDGFGLPPKIDGFGFNELETLENGGVSKETSKETSNATALESMHGLKALENGGVLKGMSKETSNTTALEHRSLSYSCIERNVKRDVQKNVKRNFKRGVKRDGCGIPYGGWTLSWRCIKKSCCI